DGEGARPGPRGEAQPDATVLGDRLRAQAREGGGDVPRRRRDARPRQRGGAERDRTQDQQGQKRQGEGSLDERESSPAPAAAHLEPTVIRSLIFSNVFSPMPVTLSRSSTFLNGPFFSRYSTIRCAYDGPIPG